LYETQEKCIKFQPETLSLNYVSNSTILRYLQDLGVNFDLFFNLLWKHVFAVELIRLRYDIRDEFTQRNVFQNIIEHFKPTQRKAFEYLRQYGDEFWIESDHRVVEITKKFERDLQAKLGFSEIFESLSSDVGGSVKASEERKHEVRERAQKIINEVQLRHLTQIVELVRDVLDDHVCRYYIAVDKLDEGWVDDRFKAQLIKALIEVASTFQQVRNLKIIVAVRYDLLDRVFAEARGTGVQKEKFQGLFLDLRWSKHQLTTVLDKRINYLIRSRYSKSEHVNARDVFPKAINKRHDALDWMLERTLLRPRDLIALVNSFIRNSEGSATISASVMKAAEGEYSRGRLEALCSEWEIVYPNLGIFIDLLKGRPSFFDVADLTDETLMTFAEIQLTKSTTEIGREDLLSAALEAFYLSEEGSPFRQVLFSVFYQVGVVGLKLWKNSSTIYSEDGERSISRAEITPNTRVAVHPCFWRVLGTDRREQLEAAV
jgi:hypothetical protein